MKRKKSTRLLLLLALCICLVVAMSVTALAEGEDAVSNPFMQTFWALVPPIVAIVLALITKEVYSSLFIGILIGALFVNNFSPVGTLNSVVNGFIGSLSDGWNVGILLFLVMLGVMVALMNKAGGSAAFGKWTRTHVKTRKGAQLATFALGVLIFVDDYFNCLTVGSVMRPVTDSHNISRAKLAYLIDATAAPVCMIAPISSWAAAVSGYIEGYNGIEVFVRAIPYNYYSLLTIVMIITISLMNLDYGPMKKHEDNARNGDLFTTPDRPYGDDIMDDKVETKAKVIDLVLPVLFLVLSCVVGMIYTGGFFDGETFVNSFANCDASLGLPLGAIVALVFAIIYYLARRVLSFKQSMECVPEGFVQMVAPILILTFAWTLSGMTGTLGGKEYVAGVMASAAGSLFRFLPAIIFVVACLLAFATGTSWGTMGILIPIVVPIFTNDFKLLIIGISACCAGAVCGDHCSPISDTTIMASAGAHCNHINHVNTQLPYALTAVAVSFVSYIIAGLIENVVVCLLIAIALMVGTLFVIRSIVTKKQPVGK